MSSKSTFKQKVLLCGPAGVGKTSLVMRFIKSRFQSEYKLTVGVDILTKDVQLDNGETVTLTLWDIGGQDRFAFIRSTFYRGAKGALLVFDLSRAATWDDIKNWRAEIKQFAGDIPFVLIGNKLDLLPDVGEVIDREECKRYAESEGTIYIETSAKNNIRVDEAFKTLAQMIHDKYIA
ncbi:MAG: Rab family GTPase [Promethearchaeota archaeon]